MATYVPTIGLEIHAELKTKTKMFCDSLNDPDEKRPNVNVCPICMGHPGTLPVANREAIRKLISVGVALHGTITPETFFERKNYFYPDLPKGYQITQFQKPFCRDGYLAVGGPGGKKIRLERIHLEEDVGRSYHTDDGSLIDYNRAGIPLMELVTRPDLSSAQEVLAFAQELRLVLRYLGASDADMEKGQMRVEVNISMAPEGAGTLGTKVEVKNINSISAAGRAVEYETERQTKLLKAGEKVTQETRGWDENKGVSVSQRLKEGSADYRYFPEPDLPPIVLGEEEIASIRAGLPELPEQRRVRFAAEYELPPSDIEVFTVNRALGDYYEHVVSEAAVLNASDGTRLRKLAANYVITELSRMAGGAGIDPTATKIIPAMFADFVVRVGEGQVSSSGAQTLLREMFATGLNPDHIIHEKDLAQVSDLDELNGIVERVIGEHGEAVADYKKGKEASLKFLIGKTMAASKGKANPQVVEKLIREKLL